MIKNITDQRKFRLFIIFFLLLIAFPVSAEEEISYPIFEGCNRQILDYNNNGSLKSDHTDQRIFKSNWLAGNIDLADINEDGVVDDYDLNCYAEAYNFLYHESDTTYYPSKIVSPISLSLETGELNLTVEYDKFKKNDSYLLIIHEFGNDKDNLSVNKRLEKSEITADGNILKITKKLPLLLHDNMIIKFCREVEYNGRRECGQYTVINLDRNYEINVNENEVISEEKKLIAKVPNNYEKVYFIINGYGIFEQIEAVYSEERSQWEYTINPSQYENGDYLIRIAYHSYLPIDSHPPDSYSGMIPFKIDNGGNSGNNIIIDPEIVSIEESAVDKIIEAGSDPRIDEVLIDKELKVLEVETEEFIQNVNKEPVLKLNGSGPPNSVITLYIYSDSPLIVQVETDESGNWTYELKETLEDGAHVVYVTITDDTGKIEKKSSPLQFFVKEAKSITEEEFLRSTTPVTEKNSSALRSYILISLSVVALVILIFLSFKMRNKTSEDNQQSE